MILRRLPIYKAVPATDDAPVLEAGAITARGLVALLTTLRANIAELDERIGQLVASHPDAAIFSSLPGAGAALIPHLIVAFGTHRERFDSAYEMQCYSGVSPVQEASGKSQWVHFRWTCPKFLRQTFHEFASASIPHSEWANAFYHHQRDRGAGHHAAIRSLAYRWMRILFRCWKDRKPYDDALYLAQLTRKKSPIIRRLAA